MQIQNFKYQGDVTVVVRSLPTLHGHTRIHIKGPLICLRQQCHKKCFGTFL